MIGAVMREILQLVIVLLSRFIVTIMSLGGLVLLWKNFTQTRILNIDGGSCQKCHINQIHKHEDQLETSEDT